jgi:hypothetical protein
MIIFIFQMVHQDNTAQVFILSLLMATWAAPISVLRKLIGIGTDFSMLSLMESQVP